MRRTRSSKTNWHVSLWRSSNSVIRMKTLPHRSLMRLTLSRKRFRASLLHSNSSVMPVSSRLVRCRSHWMISRQLKRWLTMARASRCLCQARLPTSRSSQCINSRSRMPRRHNLNSQCINSRSRMTRRYNRSSQCISNHSHMPRRYNRSSQCISNHSLMPRRYNRSSRCISNRSKPNRRVTVCFIRC